MFVDNAGVVLVDQSKSMVRILLVQEKNGHSWHFPSVVIEGVESEQTAAERAATSLLGLIEPQLDQKFSITDDAGTCFFASRQKPFPLKKGPSIEKIAWFRLNQAREKLNSHKQIRILAAAVEHLCGLNRKYVNRIT